MNWGCVDNGNVPSDYVDGLGSRVPGGLVEDLGTEVLVSWPVHAEGL